MSRIKWKEFIANLLDNPQLMGRDRDYVERYQAIYLKKKTLSQGKKNHLVQLQHRMEQLKTCEEAQEKVKPIMDALNHPQAGALLTDWDRRFLSSVHSTITKGYDLSNRQKVRMDKVLNKVSADHIDARQRAICQVLHWLQEDEVYVRNVKAVAAYYREQCPIYDYGFSHAVDIALYRPHEFAGHHMDKITHKMNDKYAKQIILNLDKPPKYTIDQHVTINSQGHNYRTMEVSYADWCFLKDNGGFIVAHKQKAPNAVQGGNFCTILLIGGAVIQVQERFLKKFPKNK